MNLNKENTMKFLVMLCISLSSLMAALSYADDHASQQGQAFPVYGMANNFEVSNPAGALAAVRTFMASPAAKAFPGNVIFNEVVADGDMAGSHSLNVFYPSPEAMGQIINSDQPPAEALAFFMSMQASAEPIGSSVFRMLRGHGLSSTSGTLTLIIQLEVTDGASFSKAFDKFPPNFCKMSSKSLCLVLSSPSNLEIESIDGIRNKNA